MHKKLALTILLALLSLSLIQLAQATTTIWYENSYLNLYTWQQLDPGGGEDPIYHGTVGQLGNNEFLLSASFYLKNGTAAQTGTLGARLFKANQTAMYSWKPITSADVQETSNSTYDLSSLTEAIYVTFNFSATYNLTSDERWTVQLYQVSNPNAIYWLGVSASGGRCYSTTGVTWTSHQYGVIATIYTTDTEGGVGEEPETPGGDSGYTWTTYDELIEDFVAFVVPVVIIFLPAILLCFITRRWDKWLILIGLAIGVGLGFYFGMVPLWLVFLVTIGLIGMAYQSVRGGG